VFPIRKGGEWSRHLACLAAEGRQDACPAFGFPHQERWSVQQTPRTPERGQAALSCAPRNSQLEVFALSQCLSFSGVLSQAALHLAKTSRVCAPIENSEEPFLANQSTCRQVNKLKLPGCPLVAAAPRRAWTLQKREKNGRNQDHLRSWAQSRA
jgi:hypothetical protein